MKEASIHKIVKKLSRLKDIDSSCIIFLGAGASVTSGIPTSSGIIEHIKDSSKLSSFTSNDSDDYFEIMADLHPGERRRIFKTFIEKSEINQTYLITSLLVHLGYADVVLTTNFDPLIKNALSLINQEVTDIDLSNNVNITGYALEMPVVIYLHGEYRNVWQLNTQEELIKNESNIRSILSNVAQNRTWIIVGYSGNDLVFDQLAQFEKFDEGLYWIGYKNEKPSEHLLKELLSDSTKNAHYVSGYDSDEFFTSLYNELDLYNEMVGRFLDTIPYTLKIHHKLHETVSLKLGRKRSPPKLTKNCEIWIKNQIKIPQNKPYRKKIISIYSSIIYLLKGLFTDRFTTVRDTVQALRNSKFEEAIHFSEQALVEDSTNALAHYYKGLALGSKATEVEPPSERKQLYRDMRKSFDDSRKFGAEQESPPRELDKIDDVILELWTNEHNTGAEIMNDDSVRQATENPEVTATAHFENATIIKPDGAVSYVVLSSLQYQLGNMEQATETYEHAMSIMTSPEFEDYEFLISLYFVQNRFEEARDLALRALNKYPGDESLIQFLADSYLETGQTDEAIDLIRILIQKDPESPQYYFVLGTQLFRTAQEILDSTTSTYRQVYSMETQLKQLTQAEREDLQGRINELREDAEQLEAEAFEISDLAVEEIKKAIELNPSNDNAYNVLGIIYQNRATAFFDKRNNTLDNERAMEYDQQARENLQQSREYYEQAAEINPDETEYQHALFQVYTTLGMEEEAKKITDNLD